MDPKVSPQEQRDPYEWLPPFALDEVLLLVDAASGRGLDGDPRIDQLKRVLADYDGAIADGGRSGGLPEVIVGDPSGDGAHRALTAELPAAAPDQLVEAVERLAAIDRQIKEAQARGELQGVLLQPQWLVGAVNGGLIGGGGIGAGPGARPRPIQAGDGKGKRLGDLPSDEPKDTNGDPDPGGRLGDLPSEDPKDTNGDPDPGGRLGDLPSDEPPSTNGDPDPGGRLGDLPSRIGGASVHALRDRPAAEGVRVRIVLLDAWNENPGEAERLPPLLRLLNNHAELEPFNLGEWHAGRDPDPFPMPDHGPFAAALAAQVVGADLLCLSATAAARLSDEERALLDGAAAPNDGCVALEGWRVLDERGVGDLTRLLYALNTIAEQAENAGPNERTIVNLSLVVNIPVWDLMTVRLYSPFAGRWPGEPGVEGRDDRLDRALYDSVRRLHNAGVLLVAATGNNSRGRGHPRIPARFPAAYDEVLDVTAAAHDGDDEAWYANRATEQGVAVYAGDTDPRGELVGPELVGPFSDSRVPVLGTGEDPLNADGMVAWAGTSFAAPQIAALAALIWRAAPSLSPTEVRAQIRDLADSTLESGTPYVRLG